jgi:hypothetical protein
MRRGVAANLGLEQLAQALAEIEEQVDASLPDGGSKAAPADAATKPATAAAAAALEAALEAALASASLHLAAARKAIRALLQRQQSASPAAAEHGGSGTLPPSPAMAALALDIAAARDDAQRLLQSLRRGALDDDALTSLSRHVQGHVAPATLDQLHQAVANFDFPLAQAKLDAVMADALPHSQESPQ